jgi:hypothetical protein
MEKVKFYIAPKSGDGSGDGSGSGSGYGVGAGDGSGSGYGLLSFNGIAVDRIDLIPTIISAVFGNFAKAKIIHEDFTTEDCYVAKNETTYAHGKTLKDALASLNFKLHKNNYNPEELAKELKTRKMTRYDYMLITGACDFGTTRWLKENSIPLDTEMWIKEFYKKYNNLKPYGFEIFKKFYENNIE